MDVARQARSRTHARVRFENALEELYVASEECALSSKDFFACQSGLEESVEYSDRPIVRSGHQTLDTITEQFTDLLLAADNLIQVARTQLYDSISIYGEDPDHLLSKDGGLIQMLSDFLPQLNQLSQFVQSAQQLAENLLLQIHGFLNLAQNEYPNTKEFPLTRMWRTLGDLLSTFIVLDELIRCHPFLHKHWTAFVHSIRLVQHNPGQFNLDTQFGKLQQLNSVIVQLDSALMNGNIFRDSCKMFSRFDYLTTNRPFMDRFRKVIVDLLARWEQLCTSTEQTMPNTQRLLCLLALSTLYHNLLPPKQQPDAKLVQKLCASYKLVVQFHLVGDLLFTPFEFILKQIPRAETVIDRKTISAVAQAKKCQLDRQLEQLSRDAQMFEQSVSEWKEKMATRFEECTSSSSTNGQPAGQDSNWELATEKGDLLVAGAHICDKINRSVKCILNGHLAEERPLSKQNARLIFRLIELLKSITNTFNAHWPSVLESAHCATTIYASSLLCLLEANIRTAQSNSKYPFLVSALKNVEFAISLPANKRHLVLAGVSLELANYTRTLRSQSVLLDENLGKIDLFWDFGSTLARVTNLSFLYWHRLSLIETYCSNLVIESEPDIQNAKNFFDAINYCAQLFHGAKHCSQGRLRQVFGDELFAALKKILLCKLCTEIENDLRISFHAQQSATPEKLDKLLSSSVNEKGSQSSPEPSLRLLHLLNIPRIRFGDKIVDVKDFVASYLNSTFYNLSVIALHDCESYRRMRILAHYRYGLQLFDPELPTRSVDQGLDIVTMLRNVDNFVDCYSYDLVEQFFIERESQGKQLGIVRVQQIVNSLKTHGTGVLNSLVNSAYKFLRSQFQSLLQYLFDEKIKSQLMHEIRFYRDSINQLEQMYPLGRAEKMANSFRRYKTADKGGGSPAASNFLDQFRLIVIRIGNALGLVRMFNAGIVEICAPNILLDFQQSEPMVDCVAGPVGNRVQFECAKLCDRISQNVWSNLRESGDCVELLTSVFAKEFRGNEKFAHLRYFFIIVPALMLAQVEHILKCRARLTNRRITGEEASSEFQFVEDGFSMGIAYLLTLLNQQFFFNSLNWFKSIFRKFRSELEKCAQEQKEAQRRKDESLVRILAVKMNQLKEQTAEFHQIMCTLNSALTFLSNEVGEEESNETYLEDF